MTLWNIVPLKDFILPLNSLLPDSPVQSYLKFSAVLGTTLANSSNTIVPRGLSPMLMSIYTLGLDIELEDSSVTIVRTFSFTCQRFMSI